MLICISDYADWVEFCLNMVLQIYKCTAQTWSRLISNRMRPLSLCSRILQTPFPRSFHSPSTNRYSLARFSSSTFSSSSPVFTSIFSGSGTTGSKKIWESSPSWGQNKTNVTYPGMRVFTLLGTKQKQDTYILKWEWRKDEDEKNLR